MTDITEGLEALRKVTGRHCGGCTLCCFILGIDAPDLIKPPDSKCKHCAAGKGCTIYDHRPDLCRSFYCKWLIDPSLDDTWYPPTARIVINMVSNADGSNPCLVFEVDPRRADRWLKTPYFEKISQIALGIYVTNEKSDVKRGVTVRCGPHWYVMIPQADDRPYTTITMGEHIASIIPDKIGPGYIMSPLGKFEWVEVAMPAGWADIGWRSQPAVT